MSGMFALGIVPETALDEANMSRNVQVTLQILKALIEKCPRDLPLYAGATLRVFKTILRSLDVTMIEESVPTFATFCANQDPAFLAADQEYIKKLEEIVGLYASLASKDNPVQHKSAKSLPVRIRFRKAGLSAIKAFAESECLAVETGRQLSLIVPAILENIYAESGQYLSELEHLDEEKAELEKEIALRRRQSTSVVAPVDPDQHDTLAASGSIEAADRIAEMETAMIALQALKKTFAVVPRVQLRLATVEVLKFMGERINPIQHFAAETVIPMQSGSWPCMLFGMICAWAPVQDRYVILVTAVEELVRCPLRDEGLQKLYVLATITGWLLSSDINFIGLSVMDVLVGLIQRMLALLPLAPCSTKENGASNGYAKEEDPELEIHHEFESKYPSVPSKDQILSQLQRCIGCLAVHVYYTDQVADLISAILSRIKPNSSAPPTETGSNADPASSTTSLSRKPSLDGYFAYDNARLAALLSVKEILIWSNWTRPDGSSTSSPRNRVPIDIWEGTHWLLRDEIREVRTAYVDVLLIWMNLELGKADLRFPEPRHRRTPKKDASEKPKEGILAKRAVSNASHRDLSPPRPKPTFLPLLHVSIYDSALQYAAVEGEILLLHLLMSNLIAKLGVNSLQHGLPMISRLQEDVNGLEDATSKINVGSLVHGYFLAVSVYFLFDASQTGFEVKNEINERMRNGTWLHSIQIPPQQLDDIAQKELEAEREPLDAESLQPLVPFEKIPVLIDKISEGYESILYSPPNSPPNSPIRKLSSPVLDHAHIAPPKKSNHFPAQLKELLTADWSRDGIVSAAINTDGSRSGSLSGNSPITNGSGKHLTVGVAPFVASAAEPQPSPRRSQYHHLHTHSPLRGSRPTSAAHLPYQPHSLREAMLVASGTGPRSRTSHAGTQLTNSSVRSSVRVEDLKRVLSGAMPAPGTRGSLPVGGGGAEPEDSTSDSMVSYDESEMSGSPVVGATGLGTAKMVEIGSLGIAAAEGEEATAADGNVTPRPGTMATAVNVGAAGGRRGSPEPEGSAEIPPVPPVPERFGSLSPPRTVTSSSSSAAFQAGQAAPPPPQPRFDPPLTAAAAESIRSANVRESLRRSISTRDGTAGPAARLEGAQKGGQGQGWSAMDLLESIEAEGVAPPPGSQTRPLVARLRPPY
jgi:hypothetical protein